jgi:hypothetical protein
MNEIPLYSNLNHNTFASALLMHGEIYLVHRLSLRG